MSNILRLHTQHVLVGALYASCAACPATHLFSGTTCLHTPYLAQAAHCARSILPQSHALARAHSLSTRALRRLTHCTHVHAVMACRSGAHCMQRALPRAAAAEPASAALVLHHTQCAHRASPLQLHLLRSPCKSMQHQCDSRACAPFSVTAVLLLRRTVLAAASQLTCAGHRHATSRYTHLLWYALPAQAKQRARHCLLPQQPAPECASCCSLRKQA